MATKKVKMVELVGQIVDKIEEGKFEDSTNILETIIKGKLRNKITKSKDTIFPPKKK